MKLETIIADAHARKAEQEKTNQAKAEEAARAHQREIDRLETVLRLTILPVLESARQKLTNGGIECALTNGQDSTTKELRHGLTLEWCNCSQSIVFTSNSNKGVINIQSSGPGLASQPIESNRDQLNTGDVERIVETFVARALAWLPPGK